MERHNLDVLSLVFGIIFAIVGIVTLFDRFFFEVVDLRWFVPVVLIALGVGLLATSARRDDRAEPVQDEAVAGASTDQAGGPAV
ncbi:MAG: hypothetical protein WD576_00995 [Nitriliruptoraceae bacterium]